MPVLLGNKPETGSGAKPAGPEKQRPIEKVHAKIHGRLPEKRTINLAVVNVKRIDWRVAVPLLVLVLAAVAAFGKFAVIDRINRSAAAQNEVAALQSQLDDGYAAIESFGEINDLYAHYTYSGMTPEELDRVDRVEMMKMLERVVLPIAPVDNWTVSGNQLILDIEGRTLLEINQIVQLLLAEDMVDYCTVSTAATTPIRGRENIPADETVTANVIVQLKSARQEVAS